MVAYLPCSERSLRKVLMRESTSVISVVEDALRNAPCRKLASSAELTPFPDTSATTKDHVPDRWLPHRNNRRPPDASSRSTRKPRTTPSGANDGASDCAECAVPHRVLPR